MLSSILSRLESVKERFLFLEKELSNSEIVNNHQTFASYSKEYSSLKKIVEKFEEYKKNSENLVIIGSGINSSKWIFFYLTYLFILMGLILKIKNYFKRK